jgi:hypothetical protein
MGAGNAEARSTSNPPDEADARIALLPPKKRRRYSATAEQAALPARPEAAEGGGAQPSGASASTSAPLDVTLDARKLAKGEPVGSQHGVGGLSSIASCVPTPAPGLFAWPSLSAVYALVWHRNLAAEPRLALGPHMRRQTTSAPASTSSGQKASSGSGGSGVAALVAGQRPPVESRVSECKHEGCSRQARDSTQFCISHGGGWRCQREGCTTAAQGKKFCSGHGGGPRCQHPNCSKGAQQASGLCVQHGGGRRCQTQGCTKSSAGGGHCKVRPLQGCEGQQGCIVDGASAAVRQPPGSRLSLLHTPDVDVRAAGDGRRMAAASAASRRAAPSRRRPARRFAWRTEAASGVRWRAAARWSSARPSVRLTAASGSATSPAASRTPSARRACAERTARPNHRGVSPRNRTTRIDDTEQTLLGGMGALLGVICSSRLALRVHTKNKKATSRQETATHDTERTN